jgi:hypothetical protein
VQLGLRTRRRRCGGSSKAATRASSCCAFVRLLFTCAPASSRPVHDDASASGAVVSSACRAVRSPPMRLNWRRSPGRPLSERTVAEAEGWIVSVAGSPHGSDPMGRSPVTNAYRIRPTCVQLPARRAVANATWPRPPRRLSASGGSAGRRTGRPRNWPPTPRSGSTSPHGLPRRASAWLRLRRRGSPCA